MNNVTGRLWTEVMGPLATALDSLFSTELVSVPAVTLVPTGMLALLPLHAAWTDSGAGSNVRRHFLDSFAVRYAPSAAALSHSHQRAAAREGTVSLHHVLAIDEPKPITLGGPLPNSAREVSAIASLFDRSQILQQQAATRQTVCNALAEAEVSHFSCHGTNNWTNPLDSGLLMAHDQLLTVRDFLIANLPNARLATLSACETGIVGTDLPDEVIMMPSALIQAGYAGVAASLWSVADISTAMFMVRFYQYWRTDELEPVYALRAAQQWVRDTTNRQKAEYFGQFVPSLSSRLAEPVAAEFFSAAMQSQEGLDDRTFEHPFWWAAFYLTGV